MTDEPAEPLTPAERRMRTLIEPLREQHAPNRDEIVAVVGRTARWQRPVRRTLVAVGHAAAAVGGGIGSLARAGRRR